MTATVELPDSICEALRIRAEQTGSSVQDLILDAIEKEIANREIPANTGIRVQLPLIRSSRPGCLRSLTNAEADGILD